MSNKDPSPGTRFGAENGNTPGRKHTKDKLSQKFLGDLHKVWEEHGESVIRNLATSGEKGDGAALAKIMAGLEPKEIEHRRAIDSVDDDKLAQLIALLQAAKPDDEAEGPMIQ